MTQVKLASGWPPAQHFHFSKILFTAHFDLSHDSPLKLNSFFKSISVASFLSYSQVGFHCGAICAHTWNEEHATICSVDSWLSYLSLVYSQVQLERTGNDSRAKSFILIWISGLSQPRWWYFMWQYLSWKKSLWKNNSNDNSFHLLSPDQMPDTFLRSFASINSFNGLLELQIEFLKIPNISLVTYKID